MNTIAIVVVILALVAVAGLFCALYLNERSRNIQNVEKVDSLNAKISDLRCELAKMEGSDSYLKPLDSASIMSYMTKTVTSDCRDEEEDKTIYFKMRDSTYFIDYSRLPHVFKLCKPYFSDSSDIHWDILQRLAGEVTESLIMAKVRVAPGSHWELYINAGDKTIGSFKENFQSYMSIIEDADTMLARRYHEIAREEYPEEYKDEEPEAEEAHENEPTSAEDMAIKLAQSLGKKMQS